MSTIASQLFRSVVPGIVFALVTGGLVLDLLIGDRLEDEFDTVLTTKAQSLIALTEMENGVVELEFFDLALPQYSDANDPDYFVMLDAQGQTIASSPSLIVDAWLRSSNDARERRHQDVTLPDGRDGRTLHRTFVPTIDDEEGGPVSVPASVTLHLAVSREPLDALLQSVHWVLIGTGLALIGLIVFLARRGIRSTLAPLEHIGEQVAALDPGQLDQRLTLESGSDELERLTSRFNELLDRLDSAFTRERRFSADVAHELRTPLAELKTLGEVNARWPDDPELRNSFVSDHAAAVSRMERTVSTLLALARSESGVDGVDKPADLVEITRTALASVETHVAERDLCLHVRLPDAPILSNGEAQWYAILCNLIGNAVEYADHASTIEVSLEHSQSESAWRFVVSNTTCELTTEDLPCLFERLWRKDAARSSGQHSGLGLSLAKACARQLGLDIRPTMKSGGRLTMTVSRIPVLESPEAHGAIEPERSMTTGSSQLYSRVQTSDS